MHDDPQPSSDTHDTHDAVRPIPAPAVAALPALPAVDDSPAGEATRLGWRFWLAVAGFWAFFGFVVGNHVFFSMRSHGHEWNRIVVWQMGGAAAWILLTPLVLALDRRFPIRPGQIRRAILVHGATAIAFATLRLVPLTALSLLLDPFQPVPREATFAGEYKHLLTEWLFLDVTVYVAVLLFARMLEYRERHFRDQLRASHLRAELSAAELRALELEVQPHFLFNALNAIATLVRGNDRERASQMVVALADLLRLTLKRRGQVFLALTEELDHVQRYLDVQKARFGDRLEARVDLANDARRATVPGLVLQPLVENAFRHGIERKRGQGVVTVHAERQGSTLALSVADNGPGFANDATSTGSKETDGHGNKSDTGIGLANLRSRLQALYGDQWSLTFESPTGGGTIVRITLPWQAIAS